GPGSRPGSPGAGTGCLPTDDPGGIHTCRGPTRAPRSAARRAASAVTIPQVARRAGTAASWKGAVPHRGDGLLSSDLTANRGPALALHDARTARVAEHSRRLCSHRP